MNRRSLFPRRHRPMAAGLMLCVLLVAPTSLVAEQQAGRLTVWSQPSAFDEHARGGAIVLQHEDFESSQARYIPVEQFASCIEPVSQQADDACFKPGELVDGIRLKSSNGYGVIVMGTDVLDTTSMVAGAWPYRLTPSSLNYTQVEFEHGPTLVAADVYGFAIDGGTPTGASAPVTVEAFDQQGQSLGSFIVQPTASNSPAFAGFSSAVPIAMVEFGTRQEAAGAMIDNLQFGGGPGRPELAADTLGFGAVAAGAVAVRSLQVRNAGSLPLLLQVPVLDPGPFHLEEQSCSQAALPAGGECTIWLSFQPGWIDSFGATLRVYSSQTSAEQTVALEGWGVAGEAGR